MKTKRTFYKSVVILSIVTTAILLNGCKEALNNTNGYHGQVETKDSLIEDKKNQEAQALCPWCENGSRYFYKLNEGDIVLRCKNCEYIWTNPKNISLSSLSNATGEIELSEDLLGERSGWATKEDVEDSKWKNIMEINNSLIYVDICRQKLTH